jgi:hypothetical protein
VTIDNRNLNDFCAEKHFTMQEVGKTLKMDPQTVVRLFRGQPGVIEFGSDERLHKRKRKFLRISKSALERFLEKQRTAK